MSRHHHRLERSQCSSLRAWHSGYTRPSEDHQDVVVDCGWGRLIFGQTFASHEALANTLQKEKPGKRDIAMYLRDPHVVISQAPQGVFLDPSHTYRLWLDRYRPAAQPPKNFVVRLLNSRQDAEAVNELYIRQHLVPPGADFVWRRRADRQLTYIVAEEKGSGHILGVVLGVDHVEGFDDPENGSSLWALAVDAQARQPGLGEALVRQLAEHYQARARSFMDLSVMHDNMPAIHLYEKLGFVRVPVFSLKHKNPYNEPLYVAAAPEEHLNPYADIIVREARLRGIAVEVLDEEQNYFELSFGGRSIVCRESLSELTTAIAMSRCDDKAVTHRVLAKAGLRVPAQVESCDLDHDLAFLDRHGRVVVKPAHGEQGNGISVDVRTPETLRQAVESARQVSHRVLVEEFVEGQDLRVIVIDFKVVAAAVRRPAAITGTGRHSIEQLIEKQSRRRAAATGGESRIPLDEETRRAVAEAGYQMDSLLPEGETLTVRKAANLHTGGTIHDVTEQLHPTLIEVSRRAARALNIPVVGLDLLVPRVGGDQYIMIEANERPGLANHEPQPTAARFVDLLFPQTAI